MTLRVDVAVAGGGIAGSVVALGLARAGFTVTLIDDTVVTTPGEHYAMRVASINPGSESVLRRLHAWPLIEAGRVSTFDRILVWEQGGDEALQFDAADAGLPHLARILENDLVAAAVRHRLSDAEGFHRLRPARVESIATAGAHADVTTSAGDTVRCRLVVGADGAASRVRALAGIRRDVFDYRQRAVVARVASAESHGGAARQVFLAGGPLAFLPLVDGTCSIVWSMREADAADVLALDDASFCERLGDAFGHRLGAVQSSGPRAAFALHRGHATRYHAGPVALVGDACHTVHPLAGLGANQGIADAAALVDVLATARDRDQDFASSRTLAAYQRRRRPLNAATLATMDLFHLGFANEFRALSSLRSTLLGLVDGSHVARRFFVRRASGPAS